MNRKRIMTVACIVGAMIVGLVPIATAAEKADMSKPVQVYILMGQYNMVAAGKVKGDKEGTLEYAVKEKDKYPYLVNNEGDWATRKDVRYARVMSSGTGNMRKFNNEWMSIEGNGKRDRPSIRTNVSDQLSGNY